MLALPAVFYLISLSFALKTFYDPDFAESIVYDDVPEPATEPNSSTVYTQKASPFFTCTLYPAGSPLSDIRAAEVSCTWERLWGEIGFALCLAGGSASQHVCQQRVYSAGLYVAGTALIGLALIASLIALGLGAALAVADHEVLLYSPLHRSEHGGEKVEIESAAKTPASRVTSTTWRNFSLAIGVLLASLATICLLIAQYLAFNALVEDQAPSGDIALSNPPPQGILPIQSPWYLARTGLVYASMAWLTAVVGVLIASLGSCLGGL